MGPIAHGRPGRRHRALAWAVPGRGWAADYPVARVGGWRSADYRQGAAGASDAVRLPDAGHHHRAMAWARRRTEMGPRIYRAGRGGIDAAQPVREFLDVRDRRTTLLQSRAVREVSLARRNRRRAAIRYQR